jgi:hypothetical protein
MRLEQLDCCSAAVSNVQVVTTTSRILEQAQPGKQSLLQYVKVSISHRINKSKTHSNQSKTYLAKDPIVAHDL